jgi:hypothetical protein
MCPGSLFLRIAPAAIAAMTTLVARPQAVPVPNASFEGPATTFVDPTFERWTKTPRPAWYDESGGFAWDQLSGVFRNPEPGAADHIVNCDGNQAAFLFAVPEAGLFQDLPGRPGAGAVFTVGKAYELTAGVLGGAGGMTNGVSLEMSLYYVDPTGDRVTIAATNIVHDPARFPTQTRFVDVALSLPVVQPTDPWLGRPIGIRFLSTVDPALAGGYWDIDNVRLRETIAIPNPSFESPETAFVDNRVDVWEKAPKPVWYDEGNGFTWDQLSGVFRNPEPSAEDHLENADGAQAFYLFAVPSAGIHVDAASPLPPSPSAGVWSPLHAVFEPGKSFTLTLAVQGGGGGMTNGVTLELGLYYRDTNGTPQTVATTVVTHDPATFPSRRRLTDFQVRTPPVNPSDAWAGRGIGIRILSTVDPALAGGYWNIDNARLEAHPGIVLGEARVTDGRFGFTLQSEPGLRFEVLRTDGTPSPASAWTPVGSITNTTGTAGFTDPDGIAAPRFYRVRQLP